MPRTKVTRHRGVAGLGPRYALPLSRFQVDYTSCGLEMQGFLWKIIVFLPVK